MLLLLLPLFLFLLFLLPLAHSQVATKAGAELIQSQGAGASFGFPTRVQGHNALGRPRMLSQAKSWESNDKWSNWDMNWHTYGILAHALQEL